jgi:hypothetical protein
MKNISRFIILLWLLMTAQTWVCRGQTDSSLANEPSWHNALRLGAGFEKSAYFELGFSRLYIIDEAWGGSACFYGSGQISLPTKNENSKYLYGAKLGFETAWLIGMWAIELKYLTDNTNSQIYLTPKAGLSGVGFVNILYGYNLKLNKEDLLDVGNHQISLTINLSRKLFQYLK